MKRLVVTYGDMTLFDGEVGEFHWADSESAISATGKKAATKPDTARALLGALGRAAAAKRDEATVEAVE